MLKLPKTGMELFRELLKEKGLKTQKLEVKTNQLQVTYTRSWKNGKQMAPKGSVWYHAEITHWDADGHVNTGETTFQVSLLAEKQKGEDAVKEELNQIVAEKMRLLLNFKCAN